jgi:AcrR family transcriptional regulator
MKNNPRKQQIIKAAQKRFVRHGLAKTTLDEIARDLRLGKATIYHYFESKEEIFYSVLNSEIEKYIDEIKLISQDSESSVTGKLAKYLEVKLKIQENYFLIYELIMIMIKEEPLEKEKEIFDSLVFSEQNIIAEILKSIATKNKSLPDFIVLSSWGLLLLQRLQSTSVNPLEMYSEIINKIT